MFHIVIGDCEDYLENISTYEGAKKVARELQDIIINDLHRPVEVHIVDNNNHIVW